MEQQRSDTHHLDVAIAIEHGVPAAIVIYHLRWWITQNKANARHQHDGRSWTYNSISAMQRIWPYWTARQIRKIFDDLTAKGVIVKGNYSIKRNDRTMWYAFVDETAFLSKYDICQKSQMSCQKSQMDLTKKSNGFDKNVKCIIGAVNNQINIPVENKGNSQIGLSGKADDDAQKDIAVGLLMSAGVDGLVADEIVNEQGASLSSIEEVIKNGLARQVNEPRFALQAGYILAALNGARDEGKKIKPTKFSKELAKNIARKNTAKPLSPAAFAARQKQITEQLRELA